MKIIKAFHFKNNTLISAGEFDEQKGIVNSNKYPDIIITKEPETKLLKNSKEVMLYAGRIFSVSVEEYNNIWAAWHIFNWEEAESEGITEEMIFALMGKELKEELVALLNKCCFNSF